MVKMNVNGCSRIFLKIIYIYFLFKNRKWLMKRMNLIHIQNIMENKFFPDFKFCFNILEHFPEKYQKIMFNLI